MSRMCLQLCWMEMSDREICNKLTRLYQIKLFLQLVLLIVHSNKSTHFTEKTVKIIWIVGTMGLTDTFKCLFWAMCSTPYIQSIGCFDVLRHNSVIPYLNTCLSGYYFWVVFMNKKWGTCFSFHFYRRCDVVLRSRIAIRMVIYVHLCA